MDKYFFSKNNFDLLVDILSTKLSEKYDTNIAETLHIREKLYDVMKHVYDTKTNYLSQDMQQQSGMEQARELSKHVLVIAMQRFSKIINVSQPRRPESANGRTRTPTRMISVPKASRLDEGADETTFDESSASRLLSSIRNWTNLDSGLKKEQLHWRYPCETSQPPTVLRP